MKSYSAVRWQIFDEFDVVEAYYSSTQEKKQQSLVATQDTPENSATVVQMVEPAVPAFRCEQCSYHSTSST